MKIEFSQFVLKFSRFSHKPIGLNFTTLFSILISQVTHSPVFLVIFSFVLGGFAVEDFLRIPSKESYLCILRLNCLYNVATLDFFKLNIFFFFFLMFVPGNFRFNVSFPHSFLEIPQMSEGVLLPKLPILAVHKID